MFGHTQTNHQHTVVCFLLSATYVSATQRHLLQCLCQSMMYTPKHTFRPHERQSWCIHGFIFASRWEAALLAVVPDASPSILLIITSNEVLRSRNFAFRPLEAFATTSSSADRQTPACLEDLLMTGTLTLSGILLLAVELGVAIDVCPPSACSVCHITLSASITIRKSPVSVHLFVSVSELSPISLS